MASFSGDRAQTGTRIEGVRGSMPTTPTVEVDRLSYIHGKLGEHPTEQVAPILATAYQCSADILAAAGGGDAADRLAAAVYASAVVVALAAEGALDATDTRVTVAALAAARDEPFAAAAFDVYLRSTASPALLELPPRVAAEIQLKLLLHLDIAMEASIWRRVDGGSVECVLALGGSSTAQKRLRAAASAAITGSGRLSLVGRSNLRSVPVRRFGAPAAAIVIQMYGDPRRDVDAYLAAAGAALSPVIERELLLERSAAREKTLVAAGEKRLMRLGFDLHDGPIQDVLALKGEVQRLRDEVYPFVAESHRDLASGRFDDILGRLTNIDVGLRELSHSLETKSIVSRPLSEIIHREVDTFQERSGIEATVEVRGDPDTLSSAQRVAVYRAVQESLANVREHSGANRVDVSIRARRSSIDVRVADDGHGFEVSRSLARAAQRGRLGLVGMGERVRLLGGTFEIDSRPGGPTTLRFSLPRSEPLTAAQITGR